MPDNIQHVIVLMLENRSFDQMLGCLQGSNSQVDGVDTANPGNPRQISWQPPGTPPPAPIVLSQQGGSDDQQLAGHDPPHDYGDVILQIGNANTGFLQSFGNAFPGASVAALQQIMSYFELNTLTSLHTLAQNFLVCDRWFSSLPGPTWPNRFFVHSGTSKGHVDMSYLPTLLGDYDQTTFYDLLQNKVSWNIYYGDIPQSLLLTHQREYADRYRHLAGDFLSDAAGPAGNFPAYAFIEPNYFGPNESDQHPVHGVANGEALIATVYNAIRANEELWKSTLLIVLYDEHGGFYDHVYPDPNRADLGATVAPDQYTSAFKFDQLGVRVPAILVSPWLPKGVTHAKYDHTSILHYAGAKWSLDLGALGMRVPQANGFENEFQAQFREDTPSALPQPALTVTPQTTPLTDHQQALLSFSQYLETQMSTTQPADAVSDRLLRAAPLNPGDVADVVRERTEAFLTHRRALSGKPRN